jgi:zinc D-Ala-D-Ala carboxypeptidase
MAHTSRPQADSRAHRLLLASLVAAVSMTGLAGCYPRASSADDGRPNASGASRPAHPRGHGAVPGELALPPRGDQQALDTADGEVPDHVTVFDSQYAAVAKLDPELLSALRLAATAAEGDGVQIYVDSGWRSRSYQEQLFRDAVATYGSARLAARWVARPGTSAHESGRAVDVGPDDATSWLSQHGAADGLCQIYANEPWHFELRPSAVTRGCPAMYADPTRDPRLQP